MWMHLFLDVRVLQCYNKTWSRYGPRNIITTIMLLSFCYAMRFELHQILSKIRNTWPSNVVCECVKFKWRQSHMTCYRNFEMVTTDTWSAWALWNMEIYVGTQSPRYFNCCCIVISQPNLSVVVHRRSIDLIYIELPMFWHSDTPTASCSRRDIIGYLVKHRDAT